MEENRCRICDNIEANKEVVLNATLYGTKGRFKYFICNRCGALQISKKPENIEEYYDNGSYYSFNMNNREFRNELLFKELKQQHGDKSLIGTIMNVLYPVDYNYTNLITEDMKILDVGCGDGQFLRWLERLGCQNLYGFEPYIDNEVNKGSIRILKTDLLSYDGNECFDVITMIHSLEHVYEQKETIKKIYSLLNNGGKVVLQLPFFSKYYWNKYGTDLYTLDPPRHFYIHTYDSLVGMMKKIGFSLIYFDTEFDPAIPQMAKNVKRGNTQKNIGTGFISGTISALCSMRIRKRLKNQKDGAIATFIFEK